MRRSLFCFLIGLSIPVAGCNAVQKKHDSPVMAAAPIRVEPEEPADEEEYLQTASRRPKEKEDDGSNTLQVKAELKNPWDNWTDDTDIFNSQVAATVNGAPILNGDILDRYALQLANLREQMAKMSRDPMMKAKAPSPSDYEKYRYQLIQSQIFDFIKKKLLVERLKSGLKPDQIKMMDGHIDELFEKEIVRLKRDLKVGNKTELEMELKKKGTSLKTVKDNFALERLAGECIAIKSDKPEAIVRSDLLEYYQAHLDDFSVSAKVRWQQIQVSITPDMDRKAAKQKLEAAIAELNKGVPFETVAKKYSDGRTAKEGGKWDWMEEGNLSDEKLEKKLFSMPINQLSEIHEVFDSLCVVQVTERRQAGHKPFKEVHQDIRKVLEDEQHRKRSMKLIKDLFTSAVIETQYAIPQFAAEDGQQ